MMRKEGECLLMRVKYRCDGFIMIRMLLRILIESGRNINLCNWDSNKNK